MRIHNRGLLVWCVVSSAFLGCSSDGGPAGGDSMDMSTGGDPLKVESVSKRAAACSGAPGAASRCEAYDVVCEGLPAAVVEVAYYNRTAGTSDKGSIVFGSGGDGTGFYNYTQTKRLLDAGYNVIDRRWPAGWFTAGTAGPQQTACRLAALLRYLRASVAPTGAFCATGNSGGSAELSYALTWQGAGKVLDFALPSSGPFHRLDLACQGETDAAWKAQCQMLISTRCPDCQSRICQLGNGPRSLIDNSFSALPKCSAATAMDLATLKTLGPAQGPNAATLDGAPVRFLTGKDDSGAYAPLQTALHDALKASGASVEILYVTGAPHEMDTTSAGANAIFDALSTRCVPRAK
ncbi:MAG: hypothetical protein JNJ46_10880 [Myxococcales bacterium]|nr:hypothetical protein [Myxococcales bacterium]